METMICGDDGIVMLVLHIIELPYSTRIQTYFLYKIPIPQNVLNEHLLLFFYLLKVKRLHLHYLQTIHTQIV